MDMKRLPEASTDRHTGAEINIPDALIRLIKLVG